MILFDSSALLAFLQGEQGADEVGAALVGDVRCSAANWSEVAQKVRTRGADWSLVKSTLIGFGVVVEPVTADDAERAATLWTLGSGLSLADRLCLATGQRLGAHVWTADRSWGSSPTIHQIR